jgi:CheY-like chemotaxis protein
VWYYQQGEQSNQYFWKTAGGTGVNRLQTDQTVLGSPDALIVENDLFFAVRLESALKRLGYTVRTAGTIEEAHKAIARQTPQLAVISFGREALQPLALTRLLKALPDAPSVIGYISHVILAEHRAEAKAAGCELLVPNSSISTRLPELVARLMQGETTVDLS